MKDFGNGHSVFNNIAMKERKVKCDCNKCDFCEAKSANLAALKRLSSLMKKKNALPATVIANKILNPGKEPIKDIVTSTDHRFTVIEVKQIESLAAKLRQCENKTEVIEVFEKVSI